ncbi:hypothetical protein [Streptomyces sp. IMTB 2501]|uniref:hypothetical protein n=1 Tax=Streptomyces sp. IMTB 2501 TaxID=1776340 RepID=UPI0015C0717F|nr:hypothetical protein [Streptomyces sp. IMTB 2501]
MNSISATDVTLRGVGACCAVGNAVLHGLLVPDHLEEEFHIGVLFAVSGAVMLVVAAALMTLKRPMVAWLTGALVSLGMITGFLVSRTVGLPDGYYEPGWELPYGPLSLLVEGLFILAFLTWLGGAPTTGGAPAPPHAADREEMPSAVSLHGERRPRRTGVSGQQHVEPTVIRATFRRTPSHCTELTNRAEGR